MEILYVSLKRTARLTGWLYFVFAFLAVYSYMYVSPKIFIKGNINATAQKMVVHELMLRISMLADVLVNVLFVAVVLLLYQLLKTVSSITARFMGGLVMVAIPVSFIGEALQFAVLYISKGELLTGLPPAQQEDMIALLLRVNYYIGQLVTFHWGLWLIPLGWLVYTSQFIPKFFAVLLWINGLGYMITSITFILFPLSLPAVSKIVYPTYFIGELPFIFWLMIKGVRNKNNSIIQTANPVN